MKNLLSSILTGLLILLASCESDAPLKLPVLSIDDIRVAEQDEPFDLEIDLQLTEAYDKTVSVIIRTGDRSAVNDEDYVGIDELIRIDPGATQKTVFLEILGDDDFEDDEDIALILIDPINATLRENSAIITLLNDDEHTFSIPEEGIESPLEYEGMTLVWQDEFEGQALNTRDWTYETGNGSNGWGNFELQYYREQNTSLVDGHLVIEARKESFSGSAYTSSRLITMDKQSFQYGRIDIRAVLPEGQGIWPAFWMMGSNFKEVGWPACGEIDIMEMVGGDGRENTVLGTVHWLEGGNASYGGDYTLESGTFNDKFHVFSIIWDETTIRWLVDDQQYHVIDITPEGLTEFHQEFFFIFNIAVGGTLPGDPDDTIVFPQWLIVDYVRVFQMN